MKNIKKAIGLSLLALISQTAQSHTQEVKLETKNIHVPKGFDSNDNIEVIVTGNLPNTCYRRPFGETKLQNGKINIEVKATKIEDENTMCIMALVPYMVTVQLGQLPEGNYKIAVNPGSDLEKDANILVEKPSTASIDNYTYANVTSVKRVPGTDTVVIGGYHPSSCMSIEKVDVVPNDNNDTLSILPIIKQTLPVCDRMIVPFEEKVKIPELNHKDVLIHVRKIDGTASNYLIAKEH